MAMWYLAMQITLHAEEPTFTVDRGIQAKVPQGYHGWLVNKPYWLKKQTSIVGSHAGSNAFYDDMGKFWEAERGDTRQSLTLDFERPVELSALKYHTGALAAETCPRALQAFFTDGSLTLTLTLTPALTLILTFEVFFTDGLEGNPDGFGAKWALAAEYQGPKAPGWQGPIEFSPRVARFWKVTITSTHGGRSNGVRLSAIRFHGFGDGIKSIGSITEEKQIPEKPLAWLDTAMQATAEEEEDLDEIEARQQALEAARTRRQAKVPEHSVAHWMRQEASKQLTRLMLGKKLTAEGTAVVYASMGERRLVDAIVPGAFWTERGGYSASAQRSMREITLDKEEPFTAPPGDVDLLIFTRQ